MIDLLRSRRSIRRYQERPVEAEKRALLEEALLRAPSSRNQHSWEFVVVDDRALLERLSRARDHGSSFLAGAPLGIVVCGDESRSDVWIEDCSIAAIILQLAAHSLGLGSCWVQVRKRPHGGGGTAGDYVREVLGIPEHLRVEAMVAVGYPAEEPAPRQLVESDHARVHRNGYGGG